MTNAQIRVQSNALKIAASLFLATIPLQSYAFAQQASIAQTAPPPPVELTFKVTPDEINLISEGLQEMSIRRAMPLIAKLRQQIADQQPKPVAPAEPPK